MAPDNYNGSFSAYKAVQVMIPLNLTSFNGGGIGCIYYRLINNYMLITCTYMLLIEKKGRLFPWYLTYIPTHIILSAGGTIHMSYVRQQFQEESSFLAYAIIIMVLPGTAM